MNIFKYLKRLLWYPLLYRTIYKYHILDLRHGGNGYEVGWHDSDQQILQANFLILKNFIEKEHALDRNIDWEYDTQYKKIKQEIKTLYDWWSVGRAKDHEKLRKEWDKQEVQYFPTIVIGANSKDLLKQEEELYVKDTEMLIRLIKIRGYLWT